VIRVRGFSLVELLVTLGIATILMSIAVPTYRTISMNAKQTGAVNELVSGMHLARNTAITLNTRAAVCATSNGATCEVIGWNKGWIVFRDMDNDQFRDANETILGMAPGVTGLSISSSQFPLAFTYRPNGRVMNASLAANTGEFALCDSRGSEHAKVVILDMSGRPRLSDVNADGSAPSCDEAEAL